MTPYESGVELAQQFNVPGHLKQAYAQGFAEAMEKHAAITGVAAKYTSSVLGRIARNPKLLFRGHSILSPYHARGWAHATGLVSDAARYGKQLTPTERLVGVYRSAPNQKYFRPDDLSRVMTNNTMGKSRMPIGHSFNNARDRFLIESRRQTPIMRNSREWTSGRLDIGDTGNLYETAVTSGANRFLGWRAYDKKLDRLRKLTPKELQAF